MTQHFYAPWKSNSISRNACRRKHRPVCVCEWIARKSRGFLHHGRVVISFSATPTPITNPCHSHHRFRAPSLSSPLHFLQGRCCLATPFTHEATQTIGAQEGADPDRQPSGNRSHIFLQTRYHFSRHKVTFLRNLYLVASTYRARVSAFLLLSCMTVFGLWYGILACFLIAPVIAMLHIRSKTISWLSVSPVKP